MSQEKYEKLAKRMLESGHVDEAIEVLKATGKAADTKEARPKWWKSRQQVVPGAILISAMAQPARGPSEEIIAHIKEGAPGSFYVTTVRGLAGPNGARLYKKGPHDSFEAAAEEAYRAWNKHGRVWVGE